MNAPLPLMLPDVQATPDVRGIALQRVGIKSVRHPVLIASSRHDVAPLPSVATIDMYVSLPAEVKGTHMSRFLEVLQAHDAPISFESLHGLMRAMLQRLDATDGHITLRMPYFRMKTAPVSGVQSLLDYDIAFEAVQQDGTFTLAQTVVVPVTSLCPCSKDISAYGAHNQRSHVTIRATLRAPLDGDALIDIAEASASCEVYGLLKRPDEKHVTERAYDNPKFVEDLVRDVALKLDELEAVSSYRVESENFESIHNHSAYACLERSRVDAN